ncbi:MAG: hypothetical protein ACRCVT_13000 [Leadbetterella sp.]
MLKSSRLIKIIIAASIFMALFTAYQLPFGFIQRTFKEIFLGIAGVLVFLLLGFSSEAKNRWANILLIVMIALTAFLYFFETK